MTKLRGRWVIVAACLASVGSLYSAASTTTTDLKVRIVGTASFQGRFTALIEDLNTQSDSFYKVGDPIYGHKITEITAEGVKLEKDGKTSYLAFDTKTSTERNAVKDEPKTLAMVVPTPEAGSASSYNFYSDKASKSTTRWDLFTPQQEKEVKKPSIAGTVEKKAKTVAAAVSGRFRLPIANYKRLSSKFGYRKHPIGGGSKMHKGIDFSANRGTRILSADNGVIKFSGWKGGYGYCVIVDHQNGYETLYGHCSKLIADVGDNVSRGDLIAEVGSTGASTGNHLHFEVHKNGTAIDPIKFLPSL